MKRIQILFLQAVVVLIGFVALAIMTRLPLTEGRAANMDLFSIYADPFLIYGYVASIAFFVALYQAFKLLGYIGQDDAFSKASIRALRIIRYCAIVLSVMIVAAGAYIRIFHATDDDPAGFLALCIVTTFISIVIATIAAVLERTFQSALDLKSE